MEGTSGQDLRTGNEDARREAARLLGSITSEKKAASSRENAKKASLTAGRKVKPLAEIACTCGVGDGLEGHKAICLRQQAIKRRQQRGLPLE